MPQEIWLRPNRRVLLLAVVPPALGALVGAGVFCWTRGPVAATGLVLALLLSAVAGLVLWELRQPRLAYADGKLLVHLGPGPVIRVPIEVVECFFLGQGPSLLPHGDMSRTSNIVVRLAESAKPWKQVRVHPRLGQWSDGYIVLRGAWTEPIDLELLQRLNAKLVEAHRSAGELKKQAAR